jgi:hypothetical protein
MGKPPADDRLFEVRNIDDIIKLKLRFILSMMAEKIFCVICDEDVEIVKAIPHVHYLNGNLQGLTLRFVFRSLFSANV